MSGEDFARRYFHRAALLAPMEDVTSAVFRRICRARGAALCFTEFVNVDGLLAGEHAARAKLALASDDRPTAVQIYGSDPARLAAAAQIAAAVEPAFIDINCGCWVPRVAGRGAGAGWLREPDAMVSMARRVVASVALPVTVKTRIGFGNETVMPVVDLARRLEDAGVRAITVHCRTAKMGHEGRADWTWAARVREAVAIPVVVNGDIDSAGAARRALDSTGCAAVMVGRRAIVHPWIFREIRALLDTGVGPPPPTAAERVAVCRDHLALAVGERGERGGVRAARRYFAGYLRPLPGAAALCAEIDACVEQAAVHDALDRFEQALAAGGVVRPVATVREPGRPRRRRDAIDADEGAWERY